MVEDCHEYFVNDILVHNCIGWLLCHWLLTQGKNLSHYGIDISKVMSNIVTKAVETPEISHNRIEQDNIRTRITEIADKLSKEQDEFVCMKLEHELRMLDKQIVLETGEIYSLDSLIEQARSAKRGKQRDFQNKPRDDTGYRAMYADNTIVANRGMFSDSPMNTNEMFGLRR